MRGGVNRGRVRIAAMFPIAMTLGLPACAGHAPIGDMAADAIVRNAVDHRVTTSVFFGVHSVDGKVVHEKFDRDELVTIAPGKRLLTLRYYSQSLFGEPTGESECALTLAAYSGAVYRVEGVARDGRWRARAVDDRAGTEFHCVFADGTLWGGVRGANAGEIAARAAPPPGAASSPAPVSPAGAALAGAEEPGTVAVPFPSALALRITNPQEADATDVEKAPGAAAAATKPGGAAAESTRRELAPALVQVPANAAVTEAEPAASAGSGGVTEALDVVRRVLTQQMQVDWGCEAGYLRARQLDPDGTLVLKGSDRIRLLGVDVGEAANLDLTDACVRLGFDEKNPQPGERDRDGRLFAFVFLPDGKLVNEEILRSGQARVDTRWRHRYLGDFLAAQSEAREAGRGIWSSP